MKRRAWMVLSCLILATGFCWAVEEPDGFVINTGERFQPLAPGGDGPEWLHAVGRWQARSSDAQDWMVYEVVLDRRVPFHHLLAEVILAEPVSDLHVRLLDASRQAVIPDLFGNVAERAAGQRHLMLDIQLSDKPSAVIVQLLVPAAQEARLHVLSLTPASYEILMKTSGDFVSGAKAWVRTPLYDSKNAVLFEELLPEGDGEAIAPPPPPPLHAYGVAARQLEDFGAFPDAASDQVAATTTFALDTMPALARLDVMIRNSDPLEPIEVWLNNVKQGSLMAQYPDLEDAAYAAVDMDGAQPAWPIGRWTKAWFFIPHEALRLGDNSLVLRQRIAHPELPPLEIAHTSLQFKYPWEETASFDLRMADCNRRMTRIVEGVNDAPEEAAGQEEDTLIVRLDEEFRAIGPGSSKPGWLRGVEKAQEALNAHEIKLVISLEPGSRPQQLGLDLIYRNGWAAPLNVALAGGGRMINPDLFGEILLRGSFSSLQLVIPLKDYPQADTIVLTMTRTLALPALSRMQLKPAWPGAVVAVGHPRTEGSLAAYHFDTRSAFVPAQVIVPAMSQDD